MSPLLNAKNYTFFLNFVLSLLQLIKYRTIKRLFFFSTCKLSFTTLFTAFIDKRDCQIWWWHCKGLACIRYSIHHDVCVCVYFCAYVCVNSTESCNRQCELLSLTEYHCVYWCYRNEDSLPFIQLQDKRYQRQQQGRYKTRCWWKIWTPPPNESAFLPISFSVSGAVRGGGILGSLNKTPPHFFWSQKMGYRCWPDMSAGRWVCPDGRGHSTSHDAISGTKIILPWYRRCAIEDPYSVPCCAYRWYLSRVWGSEMKVTTHVLLWAG